MERLKYFAGIFLVFALGALVGALGTGMYIKNKISHLAEGGPFGGPPPEMAEFILRRMSRDLSLNPDQEKEIKKLLMESHQKLSKISEKYQPEFMTILDESKTAIRACLSPEQADRMDEIEKRMRRRMKGPPPFGGPPPHDQEFPFGGPPSHDQGPPPHNAELPPDFPPPFPPR